MTNNLENGRVSVFATVRRLREQRYHMVHNELQYAFIYKYIESWFDQKVTLSKAKPGLAIAEINEGHNEETKSQNESKHSDGYIEQEESENEADEETTPMESGKDSTQIPDDTVPESEDPELLLDLINKPPPITRGSNNKAKFMF